MKRNFCWRNLYQNIEIYIVYSTRIEKGRRLRKETNIEIYIAYSTRIERGRSLRKETKCRRSFLLNQPFILIITE